MIRWNCLAPRKFEFPFPGSLTSTFLVLIANQRVHAARPMPAKARSPSSVTPDTRPAEGEIGIQLPNDQRQHRTLHIYQDVLPYALC